MELDQVALEQLLGGIQIPAQPQILVDIQMELATSGCEMGDLARLISKDMGLSGAILKTANSAYYGLKQPICSILQALSLLGIDTVLNIVNTVLLRNTMNGDDVTAMSDFWDDAADIAAACALITEKLQLGSPDEAYTLGLFHDCGIPLILGRNPHYKAVLELGYADGVNRVIDSENAQFKSNHAVLGYFVARSWKLPAHIGTLIAQHHDVVRIYSETGGSGRIDKNLLSALKIAEHLCGTYRVIGAQLIDHEFERIKQPLLTYLGLTEIDLGNLYDDLIDHGITH